MSRVVLITGAGQGLGLCVARIHAELGDKVYALFRRPSERLESLEAKYDNLQTFQCDISSTQSVNLSTKAIKGERKIDILYNNAGVFRFEDRVSLLDTDLDQCAIMFDINAVGALRICKAFYSKLKKGSLVITISSEAGSIGGCRRSQEYGYSMSKAALNMAMKTLSNDLHTQGVRVLLIHPGWLRTKMGGDAALESSRSISPEESAASIVEIANDIDSIPADQMFMRQTREILPW